MESGMGGRGTSQGGKKDTAPSSKNPYLSIWNFWVARGEGLVRGEFRLDDRGVGFQGQLPNCPLHLFRPHPTPQSAMWPLAWVLTLLTLGLTGGKTCTTAHGCVGVEAGWPPTMVGGVQGVANHEFCPLPLGPVPRGQTLESFRLVPV